MRLYLFFLFVTIPFSIYSQTTTDVVIVDSKSRAPVPYCYLVSQDNSFNTISDSLGHLSVALDSAVNFYVTNIGYEKKVIRINPSDRKLVVLLDTKDYKMDEVVVFGEKYRTYTVKVKPRVRGRVVENYNNVGCIEAKLFDGYKNARLAKVFLYVTEKGNPESDFRILLFQNSKGVPGTNITLHNIIAKGKAGKWVEVDLRAYNIRMPEEGAFIGVEWVENANDVTFVSPFKLKGNEFAKFYGIVTGTINSKNALKHPSYYYTRKYGWWRSGLELLVGAEFVVRK